jgi:predicted nuclease of predicted toxin-antitoxin system
VILSRARDEGWVLVTADHDFVQMLFASGDTGPSVILIRDVQALRSAELAGLLADALASGLAEMLPDGVIASLTPERVRVRPLPLRPAGLPDD